ncbi:hypothetical protein [Gordonia hongkongensis]|uniref:hypothetical protein n=1 Tax=Gordonia hongkongensis TaxID=1701090 RepID=UPI003D753880
MLTTTDALALADATVDGFITESRVELPTDPADRRALARALTIRLLNSITARDHILESDAERRRRKRRLLYPRHATRIWLVDHLENLKPAEQLAANWITHLAQAVKECSPRETARYRPTLTAARCTDDLTLRMALDQLATDDKLVDELLTLIPPLIALCIRAPGYLS